jgi:methyl-accepting chemotaxis protein
MIMEDVIVLSDEEPLAPVDLDQEALLRDWLAMAPAALKVNDELLSTLSQQLLTSLLSQMWVNVKGNALAQPFDSDEADQRALGQLADLVNQTGSGLRALFQHLAGLKEVLLRHASASFNGTIAEFASLSQSMEWVIEGWRQTLLMTTHGATHNRSMLLDVVQQLSNTSQTLHEHVCTAVQQVVMDTEAAVTQLFSQQRAISDASGKLNANLQQFNERSEGLQHDFQINLDVITEASETATHLPKQLRKERDQLERLLESVLALADRAHIIKRISSETRSLSINAKIEAVRAGEYGKGFSVVADEVRTLAKNSLDASEQIQEKLKTLNDIMTHSFGQDFENNLMEKEGVLQDMNRAAQQLAHVWQYMRGFYHDELRSEAMMNNIALADDMIATLSSIQFQDIVRQKIERLTDLLNQQNHALQQLQGQLLEGEALSSPDVQSILTEMQGNLENYALEEQGHSDFDLGNTTSSNKIELF